MKLKTKMPKTKTQRRGRPALSAAAERTLRRMDFHSIAVARKPGTVLENPAPILQRKANAMHHWLVALFGSQYPEWVLVRQHDAHRFSFSVWSAVDEFIITFEVPRKGNADGYLGAARLKRAPYAGEQHRRGRDLYDGPYRETTWHGIVRDLVSHAFEMHTRHFPTHKRLSILARQKSRRAKGGKP
jgi:hypothetical protein